MKKIVVLLVLLQTINGFSQNAVHLINEGNSTYASNNYSNAEESYRLAVSKTDTIAAGQYDLANAIYKQKRLNEAGSFYQKAIEKATTKPERAKAFHNLGNVFFQKNKLEEAIEAYKNALRNNPADEETRYNLALAKELLKKQQKNDKNKDNKDQKDKQDDKKGQKDNKDDKKDNKDKKDGDKDKKKDDKKDGDKDKKKDDKKKDDKKDGNKDKKKDDKKDDSGDKKDNKNPNQDKQKGQKPQRSKLSPQQAKRLLAAMQNEEEKTQKKVKAQQVQGVQTQTEKDW